MFASGFEPNSEHDLVILKLQMMKTVSLKLILMALLGICQGTGMYAQGNLTVKVKNTRSAEGKVLLSVGSKYAMASAVRDSVTLQVATVPEGKCMLSVFHDENGNYQLDKDGNIPIENCAMKEIEIKEGEQVIELELQDLRNKINK